MKSVCLGWGNVLSPIMLMNGNLSVYFLRGISKHVSNLGELGAIQKWHNTKTKSIRSQNLVLKCHDCDPKSNVRKSAERKLSMVESDIDVSKIKLSASNTSTRTTKLTAIHTATKTSKSTTSHTATKVATTADSPFILDQKCNDCDPKSNV